jgi:hypothetical protein
MLDSLIDKPFSRWLPLLGTDYNDSVQQFCEMIAQQLTTPIRIIAVVNETYEIYSDLNIRYNRLLNKQIASVKTNNNTCIRWAGLYKVKGSDKTRFNPCEMSPNDTFLCLHTIDSSKMPPYSIFNDTLFIQKGFSYFVAVDSGLQGSMDLRDSGTIILNDKERLSSPETWFTQWFINLDSTTGKIDPKNLPSIPSTRLMNIAFGAPVEQFIPPADHRLRFLDMWVQVFDSYAGERLRPYGSALKALKVNFLYDEDYTVCFPPGGELAVSG